MSCRACRDAERDPMRDDFIAHCRGCEARALASVGAHVESQEIGAMTPHYRSTLERFFGDDWKQGHELVKAWADRITAANARQKARAT